jgi:hypothetical protein
MEKKMFKYRVILTLIVLILGVATSSASDSPNRAVDLVFADPLTIGSGDLSANAFGNGTYQLETEIYGQMAHIKLRFWNLDPNTNYVLWCMSLPTVSEGQLYSAPCTASDNFEITVRSDTQGAAELSARFPALQNSSNNRLSMIALVFEQEGFTYGAAIGEIAVDHYIKFVAILPDLQR